MAEVFRTGHEINERVCAALVDGFFNDDICTTYGILRGGGEWSKKQKTLLWDKGYFKPGHYDGYYRAAWDGTQAHFTYPASSNSRRWDALGIEVEPWQRLTGHILVCPPTDPVCRYFGIYNWWGDVKEQLLARYQGPKDIRIRQKGTTVPLDNDLAGCEAVVTFNSGVGWEALRRGIPVVSDPVSSTVGSFLGTSIADLGRSMAHHNRRALFSFMANRQFTLAEIENGTARSYLL